MIKRLTIFFVLGLILLAPVHSVFSDDANFYTNKLGQNIDRASSSDIIAGAVDELTETILGRPAGGLQKSSSISSLLDKYSALKVQNKAGENQLTTQNDVVAREINDKILLRAGLMDTLAWKDPAKFLAQAKKDEKLVSQALKNYTAKGKNLDPRINIAGNLESRELLSNSRVIVGHADGFKDGRSEYFYQLVDSNDKILDLSVTAQLQPSVSGKSFNVVAYKIKDHVVGDALQFNPGLVLKSAVSSDGHWSVGRATRVLVVNVFRENSDGLTQDNIPFWKILKEDPSYITAKYFSESSNINKFIVENSYGQTGVVFDLIPHIYQLPAMTPGLDIQSCIAAHNGLIISNILPKLAADGVNLANYDVILDFSNVGCGDGIAGWGHVGLPYQMRDAAGAVLNNFALTTIGVASWPPYTSLTDAENFFNGDIANVGNYVSVIVHEMGHNFGSSYHSGDCIDTSTPGECHRVGAYANNKGDYGEYSSYLDVMGNGHNPGEFNAYHKQNMGWLRDNVDTINIATNKEFTIPSAGRYKIMPIEKSRGMRAINVKGGIYSYEPGVCRQVEDFPGLGMPELTHTECGPSEEKGSGYYFEFRRPFGADSKLATGNEAVPATYAKDGGVFINYVGWNLLGTLEGDITTALGFNAMQLDGDTSSGANRSYFGYTLNDKLGSNWEDPSHHIKAGLVSQTPDYAIVDVEVGNNSSCVQNMPELTWSNDRTVARGGTNTITFELFNSNGHLCSPSKFDVSIASKPDGWNLSTVEYQKDKTLGSGEWKDVGLVISAPATATLGVNNVTLNITDRGNPDRVYSQTIPFNVYADSFRITAPVAGKNIRAGNKLTTSWSTAGLPSNATILAKLIKGGDFGTSKLVYLTPTAGTGNYDWTIPATTPAGVYYLEVSCSPTLSAFPWNYCMDYYKDGYRSIAMAGPIVILPPADSGSVKKSPDLNGDGLINAADQEILNSVINTNCADDVRGCPADLNIDGKVDQTDLGLLNYWMLLSSTSPDINRDGFVNSPKSGDNNPSSDTDVGLMVNITIVKDSCPTGITCDLNGNGRVDVGDVQRLINYSLGLIGRIPQAPTNVAVVAGDSKATISWTAPSGNILGYKVSVATSSSGVYSQVANSSTTPVIESNANATSTTISGLANGVPAYFKILAYNIAGDGVAATSSAPVIPFAVIPVQTRAFTPTNLTAQKLSKNSIKLTWSHPTGDRVGYQYVLYRRTSNSIGGWYGGVHLPITTRDFVDNGTGANRFYDGPPKASQTYYYWLITESRGNDSKNSGAVIAIAK